MIGSSIPKRSQRMVFIRVSGRGTPTVAQNGDSFNASRCT